MGVLFTLAGVALAVLGWVVLHSLAAEAAGPSLAVLGVVLAVVSYPISVTYSNEYPGKFDPRLEEYVARRVSRLTKDEFIPQYETLDSSTNKKIRELNRRVSRALRVEMLRLGQSERISTAPICGVLVVGAKHTNKTGALWDAMEHDLNGWTFVHWPHHMDYPANLPQHLGRRIVLWIDNLHDFARSGEAAAVVQFIQQLRDNGQRFLVLASCQDEEYLQEVKRFFSPLIDDLQQVPATEKLPLTEQIKRLNTDYTALAESQKSVLRTMEWLQSMRVFTFPEEVLEALHRYFQNPDSNPGNAPKWDEAMKELTARPARFVRVDERVEAQVVLLDERYNFGHWFRNNFFRNFFKKMKKAPRPQRVVEPLNAHYLNLEELDQEGSRAAHAQKITSTLERQPKAVIEVLADYPVAAETLILLGDAYLNHLGETIDNAAELASKCYEGALQLLDKDKSPEQFPGAWAAAYVGKGTAKLRIGRFSEADADFRHVTERPSPKDNFRPIPPLLVARAWHGRGDVIAAQIPGDEAKNKLDEAAMYYERAAEALPQNDTLSVETRLDRANVLFEIAQAAATRYEQSLSSTLTQPPIDKIAAAQKAYEEAQSAYTFSTAPAVWAEIQRRLGELRLMKTLWLLPAEMHVPRYQAGAIGVAPNPFANEKKALETAKIARDHFIAARNVFAPSYLPKSWSQTQVGLIRALLVIARIVAKEAESQEDEAQAWDIYSLCLATANNTDQQASLFAQSPLDWVDLQVLRAKAEIGRAPLDDAGTRGHFKEADSILTMAANKLSAFQQLLENEPSKRIPDLWRVVNSLREEIK